jgi:glycosyltransferase involved in cell wall biosynthesis
MAAPFFSVILPTRNRAQLLPRAVDSVQSQSLSDWELIIANDDSSDDTREILAAIGDDRIRAISLPEHRGAGGARNAAIRAARGRWVAFLDDDDAYCSGFLGDVRDAIDDQCKLVWSAVEFVREGPDGRTTIELSRWDLGMDRKDDDRALAAIGLSYGVCVRRELFDQLSAFDEAMPVAHDTDFFLRFISAFECVPRSYHALARVGVRHYKHNNERLTGPRHDRQRLAALDLLLHRHSALLARNPSIRTMLEEARARLALRLESRPAAKLASAAD